MTIITRRNVLQGIIAAPAVIAVERLMKVKLWVPEPEIIKPPEFWFNSYDVTEYVGEVMDWLTANLPPGYSMEIIT